MKMSFDDHMREKESQIAHNKLYLKVIIKGMPKLVNPLKTLYVYTLTTMTTTIDDDILSHDVQDCS